MATMHSGLMSFQRICNIEGWFVLYGLLDCL